jgi:hypothetical protein
VTGWKGEEEEEMRGRDFVNNNHHSETPGVVSEYDDEVLGKCNGPKENRYAESPGFTRNSLIAVPLRQQRQVGISISCLLLYGS